ncbi:hypothetical protein HYV22_02025 [Candidatus Gottesmanbacteria bacterium]|nr:hypothetical protein [Candidatus Gottesmanbacteria bacterium]
MVDTGEERIYNKLVFAHCPFQPNNVSSVKYQDRDWWKSKALVPQDINSVMVALNSWKGRNIWLGYEDQVPPGAPSGFDIPDDAEEIGTIRLTLKENTVANQKVYDDHTEIWLYEGENEAYVLPFVSLTVEFGRADGEYTGYHLCGAYAVPKDLVDGLKELFTLS